MRRDNPIVEAVRRAAHELEEVAKRAPGAEYVRGPMDRTSYVPASVRRSRVASLLWDLGLVLQALAWKWGER